MILRRCLHSLPGDFDRNQNPLFLKPFRRETVFVIGPVPLRHNPPRCGLKRNGSESKLVEREDTSPFWCMPEGGDRVRQYR